LSSCGAQKTEKPLNRRKTIETLGTTRHPKKGKKVIKKRRRTRKKGIDATSHIGGNIPFKAKENDYTS